MYCLDLMWSVSFSFQVLQSWLQGLPDDYAVKDLINEIKDWIEQGYVNSTIWKHLQNCVAPGVLPTFSQRHSGPTRSIWKRFQNLIRPRAWKRHPGRKRSGSSSSIDPGPLSPKDSSITEDSGTSASVAPDVQSSEKISSVEKKTASPGALTRKWDVFWNKEYEHYSKHCIYSV